MICSLLATPQYSGLFRERSRFRAVCDITVLTHITIFLLLEIVPLIPVSAFTFNENFLKGLENILKRGQVGIQSL